MKYSSCILLFLFLFYTLSAKELPKRITPLKAQGSPGGTLLNINSISSWYSDNGESERNPNTGNSGLSYPRGTSFAVYASGLMIGTIATDGIQSTPRVQGYGFYKTYTSGRILGNRTGVIESASAPDSRIWRIRRDYATADLSLDAAELMSKSLALVNEADVSTIREQYRIDWKNWPASKGAPFYDANNDGIYTPQFQTVNGKEIPKLFPEADEPGVAHADQVIWYVCNDIAISESPWRSKSIGLEQQVTIWGYSTKGVAENIIYKRYKIIYKGTALTPDTAKLTNMYLSHWADTDIGDAGDDFSGCDTTLSLGYSYNSKTLDAEYRKYNIASPAVGYDFLQGPIVPSQGDTANFNLKKLPGYKNLPMTSFIYFAAGGTYTDPPFTLNGSFQWYQMMRGLPPTPQGPPDPLPLIDPVSGNPTRFWLSGDPITRTGWIDGTIDNPGDRRMLQNSGPFTMAIGDTQEIVVGVVGGIGSDYLQSVSVMKENDRTVQFMYNTLFSVIPPSVTASVEYPVPGQALVRLKGVAEKGKVTSISGSISGTSIELFDDGNHQDGAANDGVFSNEVSVIRSITPVSLDLTFTDVQGSVHSIPKAIGQITTRGPVSIANANVVYENINNNGIVNNGEYVHYTVSVKNETSSPLTGVKIMTSSSTGFASEYAIGAIPSGGEVGMQSPGVFTFRLPLEYLQSGYTADIIITDDKGNRWNTSWTFPVVQTKIISDSLSSVGANIVGNNDGAVGYVLFDEAAAGKNVQIWYGGSGSSRTWTAVDLSSISLPVKLTPTAGSPVTSIGSGTFTTDQSRSSIQYNITVSALSGAITSAKVHTGTYPLTGPEIFSIPLNNTFSLQGTFPLPDSLQDDLIAGNLYVNIATTAKPGGELRGQIDNGIFPRTVLYNAPAGFSPSVFLYPESRLTGYSLFVGPAPTGIKTIMQTAPTVGNLRNQVNPEGTYRLVDSTGYYWVGKANESNVEIRFNNEVNWAFAVTRSVQPLPAQTYPIKVPFAVFKDTVRVWPIVFDRNNDSLWNTRGNGIWNSRPTFDRLYGIADTRDASNNDLTYYNPSNVVFPPVTAVIKGRFVNSANYLLRDMIIVNESKDSIPPAAGTTIRSTYFVSVKPGDVKLITLKTLGIVENDVNIVPKEFSLSQNYPNPFNPSTRIEFGLPRSSHVMLKIYDVIGREVTTLVNGTEHAGTHAVEWNGRNSIGVPVSSGLYFYTLRSGNIVLSKKMVLVK